MWLRQYYPPPPPQQKDNLAIMKGGCIRPLLVTGNALSAFELSAQFLYFRGILESLDLVADPGAIRSNSALAATASSMQWKFRELLKQQGEMCGTGEMPLGWFTLQWFEEKGHCRVEFWSFYHTMNTLYTL